MSHHPRHLAVPDEAAVATAARRVLRRLCEPDARLVVVDSLETAAVMRLTGAQPTRTAVVERDIAMAFYTREWISLLSRGRVLQFGITDVGRSALKRLISEHRRQQTPVPDWDSLFADQHRVFDADDAPAPEDAGPRLNLAESPLGLLARRRDKDGKLFLTLAQVRAGERLREDFELAQMGARVSQNWENFLTPRTRGQGAQPRGPLDGPSAARARVRAALDDLGPGLADVALRCCCHLEGLESCEKRMGWSARSGKIVLRIALQRLARHYARADGGPA